MTSGARDRTDDLLHLVDREKPARGFDMFNTDTQRRFVSSFDGLSKAILASDSLAALSQKIVEAFVSVARADVGVLRLRDGDYLRSRAAVGLEQEVAAGFSAPIDPVFADTLETDVVARLSSASGAGDDMSQGEFIRQKGLRTLHCLWLVAGKQLVGVLYLGTLTASELSDQDQTLLLALASHAAAAMLQQSSVDDLKQAVLSRDAVLSVVAHDLQNPINVISIAASMLLQRLPDATTRRPLERVMRAVQRADRMIRDLLEVNAIETGLFSIQRGQLEPTDLILAALESQQSLAAEASVIIATDLSPELPLIQADEERLLEVLENLIGNAIKFTSAGGSVTVGAVRRDGEILVSVKDTGSGISPDQLPHIFDRFWQAKKAHRRGTGLGLTICKAIVDAHGGRIWADSVIGVGTTMFFSIPAALERPTSITCPDVANILIVDDRPENIFALSAILERPEYRLVSATSGEEALRVALRERFSVALIDVAMPGMNGLEVAVHLKELERSRDIPIIFITAFGDDPEQIHRAYSAGGADYLVKPLDIEIVRKKVAVFVDLSRRRHGNGHASRNALGQH
jgi:signal transduction histidine kinase/ActR/RegA family two-component response regulator